MNSVVVLDLDWCILLVLDAFSERIPCSCVAVSSYCAAFFDLEKPCYGFLRHPSGHLLLLRLLHLVFQPRPP